ncbi:MAG TPA: DUF1453 domain-containing protein [Thermoanaerobaculia bacterium]|nr:DUF1453 domain-containing protein [Thermoanaerobaculia bacterium]
MPLVIAALALLLLLLLLLLAVPLSLFLGYRAGKARRLARRWVLTTNLVSLGISVALFLTGAAVTTLWVPRALPYCALGLLAGGVLGLLGLAATRWEATPRGLWYTPNRWLVLFVTLIVTARVSYGFWRVWHAWHRDSGQSWLDAFGVAESMAAGAVVLGYYLVYFAGLRRRVAKLAG